MPSTASRRRWMPQEILDLGVSTDLLTAASVFGFSRSMAYRLVQANEFPVPVLKVGNRWIVPTAPMVKALGLNGQPGGPGPDREVA